MSFNYNDLIKEDDFDDIDNTDQEVNIKLNRLRNMHHTVKNINFISNTLDEIYENKESIFSIKDVRINFFHMTRILNDLFLI